MAITAWSAKVLSNCYLFVREGPDFCSTDEIAPMDCPLATMAWQGWFECRVAIMALAVLKLSFDFCSDVMDMDCLTVDYSSAPGSHDYW